MLYFQFEIVFIVTVWSFLLFIWGFYIHCPDERWVCFVALLVCSWRMKRSRLCWRTRVCWTRTTWTLTPVTLPLWPVQTAETLYTSKGKRAHTHWTYSCCTETAELFQSRWCLQLFYANVGGACWLVPKPAEENSVCCCLWCLSCLPWACYHSTVKH